MTKQEALDQLHNEMQQCTRCSLAARRKTVVCGDGPVDARMMMIGEAPGANEDDGGHPFSGQAGQLLTALLSEVGITRSEIFIANVVSCHPPNNRDPLPTELIAHKYWLDQQIAIIDPAIVVTIGRIPLLTLYAQEGRKASSAVHGKVWDWHNRKLMALYHTAYILRQRSKMPVMQADMQILAKLYFGTNTATQPVIEQLRML